MSGASIQVKKNCLTFPKTPKSCIIVNDKKYKKLLTEMRAEMVRHLSERGEEFVKDGQLVVRKKTMLYGPNYPKENL